ncbi:MAG: DUF333 domain-containing protein [Acidimicrobiia bacterium]|nr:DUF333 domain-containing protein [Acidimicrobiia bacterium]
MRPPGLLTGLTMAALLFATGCGSDATTDTTTFTSTSTTTGSTAGTSSGSGTTVGLANPASVYCVSQGGEVVIVTAADGGQQGLCRLPDGTEIDEWEYYRASQGTGFDIYLQAADVGPDCDRVVAVPRAATVEGPEADALAQLLAGPTAEEKAQGLGSWFSPATAGMLRSVVIEDRVARVDFDPALATTIPNASASCGSSLLLAQLDATIGQFGSFDRVVYSLGGDVDAFYGWLQLTTPDP